MDKKWKIHVIPHTHWDREWFFTQSRANTLFANNIRDIVAVLENDPEFKTFVLDGQLSVLNDYFYEFNDQKKTISRLAKSNRLLLGPWYSQPDMFSSLGETIIRNLEYGTTIATELGNCLDIAYLPDSFGFNHNLPQIFNFFDLKNMVFWRGMKKEDNDKTVYFNWKGIDGTTINAYCYNSGYWMFSSLFPYGEVNKNNLLIKAQEIWLKTLPILKEIKARSPFSDRQILFPFGQDESPIMKHLPTLIKLFNELDKDHSWELSTFDNFFKSVPDKVDYQINSSLIWPYVARIHRTITTSRYDIKERFRTIENLIYHHLEPLQIIYRQIDPVYKNDKIIAEAMKKLLASQAHDSLGSCNSDRTNQNIMIRLGEAIDIIQSEIDILMKKLYYQLNLNHAEDLLVFNLAPYARPSMKIALNINSKFKDIELVSDHVKDFVVLKTTDQKTLASLNEYYEHKVSFIVEKMPATTYKIIKIKSKTNSNNKISQNDSLFQDQIIISEDNITFIDKTKQEFKNLFKIVPYDDMGDGYDFSPNKKGYNSLAIKTTNKLIKEIITKNFRYFEFEQTIVYKKNQSQTFKIKLSNFLDKPFDLKINSDNKSKLVKWNLEFDLGIEFDQLNDIFASQSLALMNRRNIVEEDWIAKGYKEYPALLSTNDGLIYIPKANHFSLLTFANNEYSVQNNKLTLALFRAYDYLGKADLAWRPGRLSGMHMHSPEALLQKELAFKLSFNFGTNSYTTLLNDWFLTPLTYYHNDPNRIDSFDDRFIINYNNDVLLDHYNFKNIVIDNDFLISSFRIIKDNRYQLRIANLTKATKNFNLKIDGLIIKFKLETSFNKINDESFKEINIESQKFKTIIFEM